MGVKRLSLHGPERWSLHTSGTPGAQRSAPAGPGVRGSARPSQRPASRVSARRWLVFLRRWRCLSAGTGGPAGVSAGGCSSSAAQMPSLNLGAGTQVSAVFPCVIFLSLPSSAIPGLSYLQREETKRDTSQQCRLWFPSQPAAESTLGKPRTRRERALSLCKYRLS